MLKVKFYQRNNTNPFLELLLNLGILMSGITLTNHHKNILFKL